jgi:hypothetical protein
MEPGHASTPALPPKTQMACARCANPLVWCDTCKLENYCRRCHRCVSCDSPPLSDHCIVTVLDPGLQTGFRENGTDASVEKPPTPEESMELQARIEAERAVREAEDEKTRSASAAWPAIEAISNRQQWGAVGRCPRCVASPTTGMEPAVRIAGTTAAPQPEERRDRTVDSTAGSGRIIAKRELDA